MLNRIKPRTLSWVVLAVVTIVALVFGSLDSEDSATPAERSVFSRDDSLSTMFWSAGFESSAPIAQVIKAEIKEQVDRGRTDSEIRAYYVEQYGQWVNLNLVAADSTLLFGLPHFLLWELRSVVDFSFCKKEI